MGMAQLSSLNTGTWTWLSTLVVRMFGTENRPTENPVAARDEVFEFIIFRGQDIKDIRLCEPPTPQPPMPGTLPYDPAIVQHSVPAPVAVGGLGAAQMQQQAMQTQMMRQPSYGPMGGLTAYPGLEAAAPGGPLGQLGNLVTPGLGGKTCWPWHLCDILLHVASIIRIYV